MKISLSFFIFLFFLGSLSAQENSDSLVNLPQGLVYASTVLGDADIHPLTSSSTILVDYGTRKRTIYLLTDGQIITDTLQLKDVCSITPLTAESFAVLATDEAHHVKVSNGKMRVDKTLKSPPPCGLFTGKDDATLLCRYTKLKKNVITDTYYFSSSKENKIVLEGLTYNQKNYKHLNESAIYSSQNLNVDGNKIKFVFSLGDTFYILDQGKTTKAIITLPEIADKWGYFQDCLKKRDIFVRFFKDEKSYAFYVLDIAQNKLVYLMDSPHVPIQFYGDEYYYRGTFEEESEDKKGRPITLKTPALYKAALYKQEKREDMLLPALPEVKPLFEED